MHIRSVHAFFFVLRCVSVCESVRRSDCLPVSVCLWFWLSVSLSVCVFLCLWVCLSVCVCVSVYLSMYVSICLSIYLSMYLIICLSALLVAVHLLRRECNCPRLRTLDLSSPLLTSCHFWSTTFPPSLPLIPLLISRLSLRWRLILNTQMMLSSQFT